MRKTVRSMIAAAAALWVVSAPAQAQYTYPGGYGGLGWAGWGAAMGGAGGETVQGSIARGMGAFAAGAGAYNQQTAIANSINAQTAMQFNQYMYLSQMETNQRYRQKMAARKKSVNETAATVYDRLRNHPETADINSGDALNVVYDELSDPRVYKKVYTAARATVPGTLVRTIPFQKASEAITTSMDDLTKKGAPEALRTKDFEPERSETRAMVDELKRKNRETGEYDQQLLEKIQANLLVILKKVDKVYTKNSRDWNESRKFLKAAYGLARMLQTPAIDVLLAGVEKRPEATLGELLNFMQAFNLRFGPAKTAEQKAAYSALYPRLVALRDQALAGYSAPAPPPPADPEQARAFFEGMDVQELTKPPVTKRSSRLD